MTEDDRTDQARVASRASLPASLRLRPSGMHAMGLVLLLAVVASVLAGPVSRDAAGSPEAGAYPPSTRLTPVSRTPVPRPLYRVPTRDPAFGTYLVRVSDQRAFKTKHHWLRNTYAKNQAWNSDGTRLLLGYDDAGVLLDGESYRDLGVRIPRSESGVWSNVDPDVFYNVSSNALVRYSVASGTETVLRTFPGYDSVSIGRGEGSPSNDDRTLVLLAGGADGTTVLSYDPVANQVLGTLPLGIAGDSLDWAAASQSGAYVALHWSQSGVGSRRGVDLYDRNLQPVRQLHPVSEHGDFGIDPAGNEVYVTFDYGDSSAEALRLLAVRLRDGRVHTVIRMPWTGTHVSCRNLDRPGWCYVSDANASAELAEDAGYDEVYAVLLDGSGIVQRFAHSHQPPEGDYGGHAMAVPSRDGTRVLFASSWRDEKAPVYAYVAGAGLPPLPLDMAPTPPAGATLLRLQPPGGPQR